MLLLFQLFLTVCHAQVLSITVGRVGNHVITSREVQMDTLMEKLLFEGRPAKSLYLEPLDSRSFVSAVNDTILEAALAKEAKNFDFVRLDDKIVRALQARVTKRLVNTAAWKSMDPQSFEWKAILERKLKARQFVKFRKESSDLPVTDAEARRYYEENRVKFGNLPFENFKERIKSFLVRSQVDRRLKDWYEVIKAKYSAKNFLAEL